MAEITENGGVTVGEGSDPTPGIDTAALLFTGSADVD